MMSIVIQTIALYIFIIYNVGTLFESLLNLLNMIQTKLFSSTVKDIFYQPKPIKIQHKTYRQLLGLDKPKKQIFVESDNQNDDFLQKLLKEEEREKKKKNSNKKTHVKTKQSKKVQDKKKKFALDSQQIKKETLKSANFDKANENNSDSKQIKAVKSQSIRYIKVSHFQKDIQNKYPNYGSQIQSKRNSLTSLKNINKKTDGINDTIKIDQSDTSPFLVNSALKNPIHFTRKSDGFKILQESQKKKRMSVPNIKIQAKLNPQKHQIVHQFNQQNIYPQFKAKPLSIKQLLGMTKLNLLQNRQKSKIISKKLFRNQQQQIRFMRNLAVMKRSQYQIPSLL